MKKNLTELVFILDRSGSMGGLESDTIGGYNSMLKKQKAEKGSVHVTTVLFDHEIEFLHDRLPINAVEPLTEKDYSVRGTTSLLDAVGTTVERLNKIQNALPDDERAEKVIFVITTDGFENSSRKYTYPKIKALIESQQKELNWEFIFLGANMDAVSEANKIGISADRSATFLSDSQGIATNYAAVTNVITGMRRAAKGTRVDASWKESIEEDVRKRSSKK